MWMWYLLPKIWNNAMRCRTQCVLSIFSCISPFFSHNAIQYATNHLMRNANKLYLSHSITISESNNMRLHSFSWFIHTSRLMLCNIVCLSIMDGFLLFICQQFLCLVQSFFHTTHQQPSEPAEQSQDLALHCTLFFLFFFWLCHACIRLQSFTN